jgi:hypothetical protein
MRRDLYENDILLWSERQWRPNVGRRATSR